MSQRVRIGGMLVGYALVCRRKAWLSMRGLWMEQESDAVALGRMIDRTSYTRRDKALELDVEGPGGVPLTGKIDGANLREGVLHEVKSSRAVEDAHRMQLRFYLWLLRLAGVTRADGQPFTGQLDYPTLRRTEAVALTDADVDRLTGIVADLTALADAPTPPERLARRRFCAACAFEELCYG